MHNVQIRAQACLIKTFLETAANPGFQQSLYHATLFKYHVLKDTSLPNPGLPPYYPASFFSILRRVSEDSPLDITKMSLKQWYLLLLEDNVTMAEVQNHREYIPCRVELLHPTTDWEVTWRLSRLPGLGSELTSFLHRLLHDLLPTRERQHRITPATPITCKLCPDNAVEDLEHTFFLCAFNREIGTKLVQSLCTTPGKLLRLEMVFKDETMELPMVFFAAASLIHIWNCRVSGKQVKLYSIRAEIESRVALLRETRFRSSADKIQEMLNSDN